MKSKLLNFKFLLITSTIFFGIFGLAKSSLAAGINCDQTTLQAAISNANSGDTIVCNAGNVTWNAGFTGLNNAKHLKLQGSGTNVTWTYSGNSPAFQIVDTTHVKQFEFAGFNVTMGSGSIPTAGFIQLYDGGRVLVHDNTFTATDVGAGFVHIRRGYGVIYKNTFIAARGGQLIQIHRAYEDIYKNWTSATGDQGYGSTATPINYIEGNTFTLINGAADDIVDATNGGVFVFRYNDVTGGVVGGHGEDSGASMLWKYVHNNKLQSGGFGYGAGIQFRGGTGIAHDNAISGAGAASIYLQNYRSCTSWVKDYGYNTNAADGTAACDFKNYGYCTTQGNNGLISCTQDSDCSSLGKGTCSQRFLSTAADTLCNVGDTNCTRYFDGNGTHNYPCRHQIGRGVNEESHPVYQWKNTINGSTILLPDILTDGNCLTGTSNIGNQVQKNRDYYNYVATFDGTSGIGDSRDVSRPVTCTAGVGWWDNSAKKFYRCTATNTWEEYFTQGACPHPDTGLTGSCDSTKVGSVGYNIAGGDTTPPAAPSGLNVQ